MRILTVNTTYKRGGAARIAQTLHCRLNNFEGYESLFAYGRGTNIQESKAVRFALQAEVNLHALLTRLTGIQGYGTWFSTRRLLNLISKWGPDVVHFHSIHGYYLNLSVAKGVSKLGIPVVWTLHDAWPLTGRCAYFFDCERWKTGCGRCPYPREYPRTYFDSSAFMWPQKRRLLGGVWNPVIVSPSQWLARLVSEATASSSRIEVIPNGIDTDHFHPWQRTQVRMELGLPQEKKILLFAAANPGAIRKGARYFFEALQHVEGDDWMVVTVGRASNVEQWLPRHVEFRQLGYIKGADAMAKIYSAADLFCITSIDDNFPTTVIEAMSCGTPVLGFSVGGIPEQVTEECGRLVPPRDARALGCAISDLLEREDLLRAMGARCRERALREYNIDRFVQKYIGLYHELTGERA